MRRKRIQLPCRRDVPSSWIYTELYTNTRHLAEREVLLFIPGGPGNDHAVYNPPDHSMVKAFSIQVDALLFDPRSCGQSEKVPTQYSHLTHYIDDIEAIRQHFKVPPQKFIVLGQSYGSIAALGYAIRYPSHLKKLILIGGAASSEFLQEAEANLKKIGTPKQQELAQKLWTGTFTGSPSENDEFFQVMTPLYQNTFKPGMPTPPFNL